MYTLLTKLHSVKLTMKLLQWLKLCLVYCELFQGAGSCVQSNTIQYCDLFA